MFQRRDAARVSDAVFLDSGLSSGHRFAMAKVTLRAVTTLVTLPVVVAAVAGNVPPPCDVLAILASVSDPRQVVVGSVAVVEEVPSCSTFPVPYSYSYRRFYMMAVLLWTQLQPSVWNVVFVVAVTISAVPLKVRRPVMFPSQYCRRMQ